MSEDKHCKLEVQALFTGGGGGVKITEGSKDDSYVSGYTLEVPTLCQDKHCKM